MCVIFSSFIIYGSHFYISRIGHSKLHLGEVLKKLRTITSLQKCLLRPRRVPQIKTERGGVNNGRKANKCSDAGTGDLGVLPTHETLPWVYLGDAGSTRPG